MRRGLSYATLTLSLVALASVVVHTARHPLGHLAGAVFVGILLISLAITSVLRLRLQGRR